MSPKDKVVVVTGGASGIGRALAQACVQAEAKAVVVADRNFAGACEVAQAIGAVAMACDVSDPEQINELARRTIAEFGRIDLYLSNAGILGRPGGLELDDAAWEAMWKVHGMAHVWAARAVVPQMVAQGGGFFMVTASAAGLLSIVESAPYAVSKHASVAFAEWLRIAYGRQGVQVACLCPQAVETPMIHEHDDVAQSSGGSAAVDGIATPEAVARAVFDVMENGQFLVLPHPQVAQYVQLKATQYDRWLGGMQKLYGQHMK
jgi:NAD(P)-dependent dehydrogenase (short-subunit alcohol dehydrogenase family)